MADTLERSLTSILDQVDLRYEVLVVDDGSKDNSVDIIKKLQKGYTNLRLISLQRDSKRKLGFTRNISVREAMGDYVFLNMDCDDVYAHCIDDFAEVFHQIENCFNKDIYLKGQKINMGKRNFLLKYGPYPNIFRGEDRNMWRRLASIEVLIPIEHQNIVTRLPKPFLERLKRFFYHAWDQLITDFRSGTTISGFLRAQLKKRSGLSLKLRLLRIILMPPAWVIAQFKEPLTMPENISGSGQFLEYWNKTKGSFREIMQSHNCEPDFSRLSQKGLQIFM